jgi:DNA-binding PadR family transcriptional regulator
VAVKHAVLGLLAERPGYGLELVSRLNERVGPNFAVPEGTVYTALSTLETEGLIRELKRVARGKITRVYYETTPDGETSFDAWMAEPIRREPLRGEVFLKFAMLTIRRIPVLRGEFERLELECLLDIAQQTQVDLAGLPDPVPPAAATRFLLDSMALDRLNAELTGIRRALSVLRWAEAEGMVSLPMLLEAVPASS